ncbi:hypothetical protein, partial [Flavobacterium sp.]|uniref:hypothetical protein n=1 Tax=Flavobacterium sp. TaxID=239 RepID=UPI0025BAB4BF
FVPSCQKKMQQKKLLAFAPSWLRVRKTRVVKKQKPSFLLASVSKKKTHRKKIRAFSPSCLRVKKLHHIKKLHDFARSYLHQKKCIS